MAVVCDPQNGQKLILQNNGRFLGAGKIGEGLWVFLKPVPQPLAASFPQSQSIVRCGHRKGKEG